MKTSVKFSSRSGMTIAEIMIVTLILVPALLVTILVFIRCMEFIELSQNTSLALRETKNKLNEIEGTAFGQISATFHQATFTDASLNGIGVCYVEAVQADLLRITISFSWRERTGRIIGEDLDRDGVIDAGEDVNGSGMLDSPVKLVTYIHQL